MPKAFNHRNGICSLVLPDGWDYKYEGSQVILSQPNRDSGAVVVSCLGPPEGIMPDAEQFIADHVIPKFALDQDRISIVQLPSPATELDIAYTEFNAKGDVWRTWVFAKKDKLVFVSYNGPPDVASKEKDTVESIIASLRVA